MTETTTLSPFNAVQNREDFKAFFLQLLEEDTIFYYTIKSKFLVKEKKTKKMPLDMVAIRKKHALKREAFFPLHDLFKDTAPASELVKLLHK
jgi:hypothetical protein